MFAKTWRREANRSNFYNCIVNRIILLALPFLLLANIHGVSQAVTGDTVICSTSSSGAQTSNSPSRPAISADGRYVAFTSYDNNLAPGDPYYGNDIYRKDLTSGKTARCSATANGTPANGWCSLPAISADGRYVAFHSDATNLVGGDTNGEYDIFRKDMDTGKIVRCSTDTSGTEANKDSFFSSVSADGRYVAFDTYATNFVPGDINDSEDVFRKDLQTGELVACSTDPSGVPGNQLSMLPSISADGNYVAFESPATNLVKGDTNKATDIFCKDIQSGEIVRCSTNSDGKQAYSHCHHVSMSSNGRFVAFISESNNLYGGDNNGEIDVFRKDIWSGETVCCSTSLFGNFGNGDCEGQDGNVSISGDGRYVSFNSSSSNLVPDDDNQVRDVYRKDLNTRKIVRVSVDASGVEGNGASVFPSMSDNGRFVAFQSEASNLAPGDSNDVDDIFRKDLDPPPYIYSLSPSSGPVGTKVTITGENLFGISKISGVFFGTVKATGIEAWDNNKIVAMVPAGASGCSSVKVVNLCGTSNTKTFRVTPTISSISPSSGKVGSIVTLKGKAFGPTPGFSKYANYKYMSSKVFFGNAAAKDYVSWNDNEIKVKVPAVKYGYTRVTVSTRGGTSNMVLFKVTK